MKFAILFLVAAVAASPAVAKDNFTGPFVGVQAGWGHSDIRTVSTDIGDFDGREATDAFTGGVFAGYDAHVVPWLVTGVEIGASWTAGGEVRRSARGQSYELDAKRYVDATVRAGVPITLGTLVYARGGYSNAHVSARLERPGATQRGSVDLDGWLVGGGLERRLLSNV